MDGKRPSPRLNHALRETSFQEGHLETFFVHDRAMPEESVLAEQLAVVGGDDEMGVRRRLFHQFADQRIDVFGTFHLLLLQALELLQVERVAHLHRPPCESTPIDFRAPCRPETCGKSLPESMYG